MSSYDDVFFVLPEEKQGVFEVIVLKKVLLGS
jgi:hypothetical protein